MENAVYYYDFNTKIGMVTIYIYNSKAVYLCLDRKCSESAIRYVKNKIKVPIFKATGPGIWNEYAKRINLYLDGKATKPDILYTLYTADFTTKVLGIVSQIEYSNTLSYSDIAELLGTRAYRAVGQAVKRNPLPLMIPCHRVVGKNDIGGFSLGKGIETKKYLMRLEKIEF